MNRQMIVLLVLVGVIGGGGYLMVYKRDAVMRKVKGYKVAETPQDAADQFKKAIQNREFLIAADYVTPAYAEQLKRGGKVAGELGTAIDNLSYQMNTRELVRDEVKLVFQALDPFPKDITIVVGPEKDGAAAATITFEVPPVRGDQPATGKWAMKPDIFQTYARGLGAVNNKVTVAMKKTPEEGWKFDLPADTGLATRVTYLNEKGNNYVNPMVVINQEVKIDPTTKENATQRLKELMEQAAKE
ncbi:MAG: hypothetical protein ACRC7O_01015 [Fimbriiglobus sp.]